MSEQDQTTAEEPRIVERAEQPYLGITCEITEGVPAAVDVAFPALFGWLGERGTAPVAAPAIRLREVDSAGEPLLLDVCAPVAAGVEGGGEVRADVLPAGRYATLRHVGPYRSEEQRDLSDARESLVAWMEGEGLVYGRASERGVELACAADHYLIGPGGPDAEPDFTRWQTDLAYLLIE